MDGDRWDFLTYCAVCDRGRLGRADRALGEPPGGSRQRRPATAAGPSVDDVVRTDGGPQETPDDPITLTPVRNCPLYVRGDVEVRDLEGAPLRRDTRLSLCRCGQARRMPLCDNTCQAMNWQEPVPADTAGRTGGPESAPPSPAEPAS